ncbi:MAG: hypothetical protein WCO60_20185, partial [Verrucomicrobiota bacterium]
KPTPNGASPPNMMNVAIPPPTPRPKGCIMDLETLNGTLYRSSQGSIDGVAGETQTSPWYWEQTCGYTSSLDSICNVRQIAEKLDRGCTSTDIRCRFVINEGADQIILPECFLSELDDEIDKALNL